MRIAGLLLCIFLILSSDSAFTQSGEEGIVTLNSDDEDGRSCMYVMNADGSGATKLMGTRVRPGVTALSVFSLSPDCKKVVFQQIDHWAAGGTIADIMVLGIDDGRLVNLTNGNPGHCSSPRWSPDGKEIVFNSYEKPDHQLYTMNWDGANLVMIGEGSTPDWSPDGRRIAYSDIQGGKARDIYIMDSNGDNEKNVTDGDLELDTVVSLRWSPTGGQILFSGYTPNNDRRVYTIDIDGNNLNLLYKANERSFGHSCWSPDGQRIAFEANLGTGEYIWVMNCDGVDLKRLTNNERMESLLDWRGPAVFGVSALPNAAKSTWGRIKSTYKP